MAVLPAPPRHTHELPGARFTSLATPSRGSSDTSVWLVELAPGQPGAAAPAHPRGGLRRPRRARARHARRRDRPGRPRRRDRRAGRRALRARGRGRGAAPRPLLPAGRRSGPAPGRRAVHPAVGAVTDPDVPLARLFAIGYRPWSTRCTNGWPRAAGPTSAPRTGSCCWRCGTGPASLRDLPRPSGPASRRCRSWSTRWWRTATSARDADPGDARAKRVRLSRGGGTCSPPSRRLPGAGGRLGRRPRRPAAGRPARRPHRGAPGDVGRVAARRPDRRLSPGARVGSEVHRGREQALPRRAAGTIRQNSTASSAISSPPAPRDQVPPAGPVRVSANGRPWAAAHSATTSATSGRRARR